MSAHQEDLVHVTGWGTNGSNVSSACEFDEATAKDLAAEVNNRLPNAAYATQGRQGKWFVQVEGTTPTQFLAKFPDVQIQDNRGERTKTLRSTAGNSNGHIGASNNSDGGRDWRERHGTQSRHEPTTNFRAR